MLDQMALYDFLQQGHYAHYLRQILPFYRQRRELLYSALQTHLGNLLTLHAPEAGLRLVG